METHSEGGTFRATEKGKGIGWINALQRFFVMNAGGIFALLWIMTLMETTLLSVLSAGMSIAA